MAARIWGWVKTVVLGWPLNLSQLFIWCIYIVAHMIHFQNNPQAKDRPTMGGTGQVWANAHTFEESTPKADSASGGFSRRFPTWLVTQTVGWLR
jgi:hypothetical protein